MPGRRSYFYKLHNDIPLSDRDNRRWQRDCYYTTSHRRPGMKFVETTLDNAKDLKTMEKGKRLHSELEKINGQAASSGKVASFRALKLEHISKAEHKANRSTFIAADAAKHVTAVPRRAPWADVMVGDDEDFSPGSEVISRIVPPASGPSFEHNPPLCGDGIRAATLGSAQSDSMLGVNAVSSGHIIGSLSVSLAEPSIAPSLSNEIACQTDLDWNYLHESAAAEIGSLRAERD